MTFAIEVEGMIEGISGSVEFKAFQSKPLTEFDVESRGGLDPLAFKQDARIAVPEEDIRLHQLTHPFGGKVVSNVGKSKPGRNADGTAEGREQNRFGDTPGPACG